MDGLRDGEYRVEVPVALKAGDAEWAWRAVGTTRARERDVELRVK